MTGDLAVFCQRCGGATSSDLVQGRYRPVCSDCGEVTFLDPKLSVAVIISCDGNILLGRRAESARASGKWSFPAGYVERGEVVESAAVREVREEVGLDVSIGRLIGVYSAQDEQVVLVVYAASSVAGEVSAGDDMDRAGWFAPDDLPELAFERDQGILEDWQSIVRDILVRCELE